MDAKILEHDCSSPSGKCQLHGVLSQIPTESIDGIAHAELMSGVVELKLYRLTGIESNGSEISLAVQNLRMSPQTLIKFAKDINRVCEAFASENKIPKTESSVIPPSGDEPKEVLGMRIG